MAPDQDNKNHKKEQPPIQELLRDSAPSPRSIYTSLARPRNVAPGTGPILPIPGQPNAQPTTERSQTVTNRNTEGQRYTVEEIRQTIDQQPRPDTSSHLFSREPRTETFRRLLQQQARPAQSMADHRGATGRHYDGHRASPLNAAPHEDQRNPLIINYRVEPVARQTHLNVHAREFRPQAHWNAALIHNALQPVQPRAPHQAPTETAPQTHGSEPRAFQPQNIQAVQAPRQHELANRQLLSEGMQPAAQPRNGGRQRARPILAVGPNEFVPTNMVIHGPGNRREPTSAEQRLMAASGMSQNYMGDPGNPFNHSADIPEEDNTSFWLIGLDPDVHESEILAPIQDCDRVYQLHVNREGVKLCRHKDAAAKLTMFTKAGATRFASRYMARQTLVVGGRRIHIRRNRNRVREQLGIPAHHTRCLKAQGPRRVLEPRFLLPYLAQRITYQLDDVIFHSSGDDDLAPSEIEIRFASYRGQAALAWHIFRKNAIFRNANVRVRYVHDPCDI